MSKPDIIFVQGLTLQAHIGVTAAERAQPQAIQLDLAMSTDIRAAAAHDDLTQTIDYQAVCDHIAAFIKTSAPFNLVETLAESIASLVLREYPIAHLKLTLGKPCAIANTTTVGVCIERPHTDSPPLPTR